MSRAARAHATDLRLTASDAAPKFRSVHRTHIKAVLLQIPKAQIRHSFRAWLPTVWSTSTRRRPGPTPLRRPSVP